MEFTATPELLLLLLNLIGLGGWGSISIWRIRTLEREVAVLRQLHEGPGGSSAHLARMEEWKVTVDRRIDRLEQRTVTTTAARRS